MKKPRAARNASGATTAKPGTGTAKPGTGTAKPGTGTAKPGAQRKSPLGAVLGLLTPRVRPVLVLAGVLAVQGVAMALVAIPAPHSGGDNAAYLTLGRALLAGEGYTEFWDPFAPPHSKYPPAYPLLLAALMGLGATTWGAFKALSAWLMLGAVALVFLWARERRGLVFAGCVALLTGLSAPWLEASRWVLSEPLFLVGVFMAVWGADRIGTDRIWPARIWPARTGSDGPIHGVSGSPARPTEEARRAPAWRWMMLALAGVLLAVFTRTAALPLFVAFLLLLAYRREWMGLLGVSGVSALPILLWILRGRAGGQGAYQNEFWMVDPYDPSLGLMGVGGFLARVAANLKIYVGEVLGAAWWGDDMAVPGVGLVDSRWILGLGLILCLLALVGWGVRVIGGRAGLAEFFFPLYAGLILLWPEVWSGDRFLLPLYPLALLWGGEALGLGWAQARTGAWRRRSTRGSDTPQERPADRPAERLKDRPTDRPAILLGALLVGLLLIPAAIRIGSVHGPTSSCRSVGATDPWACYGPTHMEFRDAAEWAGIHLPEGAVVVNRKPRIFHLLGGVPGRVFPFDTRIEPLRELAHEIGARYLLVDAVDGVSGFYLPQLVGGAPDHFCWMAQWGEVTALLVILSDEERAAFRADAEARGDDPMSVFPCGEVAPIVSPSVSAARAARSVGAAQIHGVVNPPGPRPRGPGRVARPAPRTDQRPGLTSAPD